MYRGRLADVGSADDNVMGYSYRLCTTLNKDRQVPWPKPDGYKTDDFRLLTRTLQARLANQNRTESMGSIFAMYAYASNQVSKFDLCDSQTFPVTSDAPGLAKARNAKNLNIVAPFLARSPALRRPAHAA